MVTTVNEKRSDERAARIAAKEAELAALEALVALKVAMEHEALGHEALGHEAKGRATTWLRARLPEWEAGAVSVVPVEAMDE